MAEVLYDEEVAKALDDLLASAQGLEATCKGTDATNAYDSFDWQLFDGLVAEVSKQCTNFAMTFDGQSRPKGATGVGVCRKLQTTILLFDRFAQDNLRHLSTTLGRVGSAQVRDFVAGLADSLTKLVMTVKCGRDRGRLKQTGVVWQQCDGAAQLPRDPASALILLVQRQIVLVRDAVAELHESAQLLKDNQAVIVAAVLGLMKCARAVLSKLKCSLEERGVDKKGPLAVAAIDTLTDQLQSISASVDDLAAELYALQEQMEAEQKRLGSERLESEADAMLTRLSHLLARFIDSPYFDHSIDGEKMDFLRKAIDHNREKLRKALQDYVV